MTIADTPMLISNDIIEAVRLGEQEPRVSAHCDSMAETAANRELDSMPWDAEPDKVNAERSTTSTHGTAELVAPGYHPEDVRRRADAGDLSPRMRLPVLAAGRVSMFLPLGQWRGTAGYVELYLCRERCRG